MTTTYVKRTTQKFVDTVPNVPIAGITSEPDPNDTAAGCIQPEHAGPRPVTPPEIQKFRKSFNHAPGTHFLHHGFVGMPLPDEQHRYGVRGDKGETAAEVIVTMKAGSPLAEYLQQKKEAQYKSVQREPLGHTFTRGYNMPAATKEKDFSFGIITPSSESAKNILYNDYQAVPDDSATTVQRPTNRNYNWQAANIDPNQHRFGRVDSEQTAKGTGLGVANALRDPQLSSATVVGLKRVEDFKKVTTDPLGHVPTARGVVRNLPADHAFGLASDADDWGAAQCIQGEYTTEQQQPDPFLGHPKVRRGAPPSTIDKTKPAGLASLRDDKAPPALKSVANNMNYGDEKGARHLLYPSKFSFDGVSEEEFANNRSKQEVRGIFSSIGYTLSDQEFDSIFKQAGGTDADGVSVDNFRAALNQVKHGL